MPEWSTLSLFIVAAAILVFMPGPNTLYIIARTVQQGLLAGIVSSLGVQVGSLFHIAAAALGISALLLSSALAFSIVKYAGAAYLVYLGIKTLLTREQVHEKAGTSAEEGMGRAFYQGVVVSVLNPKTALFLAAFLPQFIDVERGAVPAQVIFLGAILVALGSLGDVTYALLAGSVGNWLRGNLGFRRGQRYIAGSIYIGLGAGAALTGSNKK